MIEQKNETRSYTPDQALYLHRLKDMQNVLKYVNGGLYPLAGYEGVPLLPNGQIKGLRFGLIWALSGTYSMLVTLGLKDEADNLIHGKTDKEDR